MGVVSSVRSIRQRWRRFRYYWLGPTTAHLRLEASLLVSLTILTMGYMNNLHEGINRRDVQVLILFTIFLSRHLLLRLYLSWDPYTVRSPRNGLTVLLQSHVLQGTVFDRRCRDVGSSSSQGGVYEWTDIIPSSILYLYHVARVYVLVPLTALSSQRTPHQPPPPQHQQAHGGSHDEVHHHHNHHNHHHNHNHNKKQMDTPSSASLASNSSSHSSSWFFYWRQRVYGVWFEHIAPRVSLHWCIWILCTMDALSLGMRLYYLTDHVMMSSSSSHAEPSRRLHGGHGGGLDRLVILTGTALHWLDDAVVATGHDGDDYDDFFTTAFPHRRYIPLYRQFYMAAILSSVFTTGRLWNAPPDFYHRPMSDIATVAYVCGRWLEVMILLDLLPVQPCRAAGYCPKHCALSATGYADFRRADCDHPDVFYAWTFLVMSATVLLFGTLTAQSLTHSYAIWRNAIIRARVEWKRAEPTTTTNSTNHNNNNAPWLSNLMTTLSVPANWKDVFLQWDFFFVEKERYHRGERYHTWWWGRRTYECVKATTRPPPFFFMNSVDNNDNNNNGYGVLDTTTTPVLAWLVPIAQIQWLIGAFYLIAWLIRFFFFGIYSAWVYGLYAMVAHCLAAYAVTYPEPPIKKLAQEVNDRPKKYRL